MNEHTDHPLTAEEHALAERLRRLGPHDGPAPALDARILAAGRTAVSRPARRHRFALTALPASLVTAAGTAAAFVLAVGLVWQLRPVERPAVRPAASTATDDGFVMAEVIASGDGKNAKPTPSIEAAPAPATGEPTRDARSLAASRGARKEMIGAPRRAAAATSATSLSGRPDDTTPDAATPAPALSAPASSAPADSVPAAPTAASDPAAIRGRAAADAARDPDGAPPPPPSAAAPGRRASYTSSALATSERPGPRARISSQPTAQAPPPLAQLAVETDAELPPAQWLQRVRDRLDAGDHEGARDSLRRYRNAYPRVPIPRDLRGLLR